MRTFLTRCTLACAALALALPLSAATQPQVRDLEIPGWLISLAFPQRADGGREILLLVASPGEIGESGAEARIVAGWEAPPPSRQTNLAVGSGGAQIWTSFRSARSHEFGWEPTAPTQLLWWNPSSEQPPQLLLDTLSPKVMAIASAAPQNEDAEGLLLLEAGRLRHLPASRWLPFRTDMPPELVTEQDGIDPSGLLPRRSHHPLYDDGDSIWIGGLGALHHLVRDPESNTWIRTENIKTRITLDKTGHSLTVSSRTPMPFDPELAAPPILAAWPDSIGKERLRVTLHEFGGEGAASSRDLWLRFPGPERLLRSYPVLVDDKPVLAVWTSLADKLRLRYRPRLHVFPITEDRTRAGHLPTATTNDVGEARWRLPRPVFHDANGDGQQDLLLLYADGKRYRVDAFMQQDNLRFKPSAAVTKIDLGEVPGGTVTGYLAEDLTGDGLGDLVITTSRELLLVPGRPTSRKGNRLFEKQPSTRIAIGSDDEEVTLDTRQVDLDGNGRSEFVFTRWNPETKTMHLRIIAPAGTPTTVEAPTLP